MKGFVRPGRWREGRRRGRGWRGVPHRPLRAPTLAGEDVVFVLPTDRVAGAHQLEEDAAGGTAAAVGEREPALSLDGEGLAEHGTRPRGAEAVHRAGDEADGRGHCLAEHDGEGAGQRPHVGGHDSVRQGPLRLFRCLSPWGLRRCLCRWHGDEWRRTRLLHLSYRRVRYVAVLGRCHCRYVAFHSMSSSRVDTPDTLTIDEPAFLPARVQARELDGERVERRYYVD